MPRENNQRSNIRSQDLVQLDQTLVAPNITAQGFVDRDQFLLQRYKKLQAETQIKEEQAELERLKKERLLGQLIEVEQVEEAFQILGSKTKVSLKRLITELPPKLEGLTAQQMIDVIRNSIDEILENLSGDDFLNNEPEETKY